jgi:hypothetical protein
MEEGLKFVMSLISSIWSSVYWTETGVGTDDTCPQGSLSLLEHKVEVAVTIERIRIEPSHNTFGTLSNKVLHS